MPFHLIGADMGLGAQIHSCEDGPLILKKSHFLDKLQEPIPFDILFPMISSKEKDIPLSQALPFIVEFNKRLSDKVCEAMQKKEFPVVIGGDHSVAVGTWNGVRSSMLQKSKDPLGLIWIDAHMDSHTPQTTPSGAWHGMPLAALLGYGEESFKEIKRKEPVILPEHLCLVGVRSFEEGEAELLKRLKVRIFFIDEVKKRGLDVVMQEALSIAYRAAGGFGVSLDIDSIDPIEAPGVGSPEPDGIKSEDLISVMPLLRLQKNLRALEIVEYNPYLDIEEKTLKILYRLLEAFLTQEIVDEYAHRTGRTIRSA